MLLSMVLFFIGACYSIQAKIDAIDGLFFPLWVGMVLFGIVASVCTARICFVHRRANAARKKLDDAQGTHIPPHRAINMNIPVFDSEMPMATRGAGGSRLSRVAPLHRRSRTMAPQAVALSTAASATVPAAKPAVDVEPRVHAQYRDVGGKFLDFDWKDIREN